MEALLTKIADLFPDELPKGLPPSRPTDHRIVLLKDSIHPRHGVYGVPLTQRAELKPTVADPNELKPNVEQDPNALPPLQQSNQIDTSTGTSTATSSSASAKTEEMADISSSRKKKKKGQRP